MNVAAQRIVQPPEMSRHFWATGASHSNMLSLKTRKRTPRTRAMMVATATRIRWIGERRRYEEWAWRYSDDEVSRILVRYWEYFESVLIWARLYGRDCRRCHVGIIVLRPAGKSVTPSTGRERARAVDK